MWYNIPVKIKKSFKYRVYPTKEQQVLLAKHFGAKRFVWNYFLDQRKKEYLETKKSSNYYDNARSLTAMKKKEEFLWLKEINSQSVQATLRDLEVAYFRFFAKQGKFPRFKSKYDKQSFRVPQYTEYSDGQLWLPKFKKPIKVQEDRPIAGEILFSTISRTSTGKYYVSITCEMEQEPFEKNNKCVGIDLGIKDLAICSDGKTYANAKTTNKYAKKLAYLQRQLSKKSKTSNNRRKQKVKVARIHEKISNVRNDYLHKTTTNIVRENQTICVEDLSVVRMMKNHMLARSIADCSWGELLRQLKYKTEWNDRSFVVIDKFFPSSKTCNNCKFVNQGLTLDDREWNCPSCGAKLNRDLNASENILEQGLLILRNSDCGTQAESKQKHGEALPVAASLRAMKPHHL